MRALKIVRELGLRRSLAFLGYQLMKRSGAYRLWRAPGHPHPAPAIARPVLGGPLPGGTAGEEARDRVRGLASGNVVLFGNVEAPLDFHVPGSPGHWSAYDRGQLDGRDIKFVWEPARFGWVCDLVRVWAVDGEDRHRQFLAAAWSDFLKSNPPWLGPNWASGQEVALRLIHLAFADAAMGGCIPRFEHVVAVHAARIRLTMLYAYAQDNNHLLSEAAGLLTAGAVIPGHPAAAGWRRTGWQAFNRAVRSQFSPEGEYVQQSANYHRLALMLAVWTAFIARQIGLTFPPETAARLAAGTRWLLSLCDPDTGLVPNLGANDGARILPLSDCPFADYRPELQAAARAFLGAPAFDPGPWDETGAWLGLGGSGAPAPVRAAGPSRIAGTGAAAVAGTGIFPVPGKGRPAGMPRIDHPDLDSRAFLRAARFTARPGHADQLHVDLWLGGVNVALDPGTFSYNADPPWDNALQTAQHHNTLTVDGRDQMTRAGRFLYIDRAQAAVLEAGPARAAAEHDGYRSLGLVHRRTLEAVAGGWRIADRLEGFPGSRRVRLEGSPELRRIRLHWLLPDRPWQVEGRRLTLQGPAGPLSLEIVLPAGLPFEVALARAGQALLGPPPAPTAGWFSPTYGVKEPALSFSITFQSEAPVLIESKWVIGA